MNTVLIADDVAARRKCLAAGLVDKYNIVYADSGKQTIDIMNNSPLACILMNFNIPVMDGFKVTEFMHDRDIAGHTPVVLICDDEDGENIRKAYDTGIADMIRIPFNGIILRKRIDNIVRLYNEKRQLTDNNRKMKRTLQKENEALKSKTSFLINMSHDIRTPMLTIIGMAELARANLNNKAKAEECLNRLSAASDHLIKFINNILDMSRIENDKLILHNEECLLSELIRDVVIIVQDQIKQRNIRLELVTRNIIHDNVVTDPTRIKQVIINVMGDSFGRIADGGYMSLEISEEKSFSEGYCRYHFKFIKSKAENFKYGQTDMHKDGSIDYEYLPFNITKMIVDKMDGGIKVDSLEDGMLRIDVYMNLEVLENEEYTDDKYSGIRVLIVDDSTVASESMACYLADKGIMADTECEPYKALETYRKALESDNKYDVVITDMVMPDMNGMELAEKLREISGRNVRIIIISAFNVDDVSEAMNKKVIDAYLTKPIFRANLYKGLNAVFSQDDNGEGLTEQVTYRGKKVLVVDDNAVNRMIASDMMDDLGIESVEADCGEKAVDIIRNSQKGEYDIVFMDLQMPGIDGYEACALIRESDNEHVRNVPVVAMSAEAYDEEKFGRCGMNYYLMKPTEFGRLCEILREILEG